MTKLNLINEILNNTPADADPVDANFKAIDIHVDNELINRDGSIAMSAPLHLFADPTQPLDAATKSYVDALLPIGIIMPYGGKTAPAGRWATCDGASLPKALYPQLFGIIEYRYGGSGANFNLPKLDMRYPIGKDFTSPTPRTEFSESGKVGGTFLAPLLRHSHAMPHTHPIPHTHEHPHTHSVNPATFNTASGGGHVHDVATSVREGPEGTSHSVVQAGATGTTRSLDDNPVVDGGAHVHAIDVPATTSAQPSDATSGQPSAANSGTQSTPNTSDFGTAAVEHILPFVVVVFIIRVD